MGVKTGITWANSTWNPTVGCSIVSPGCTHCYAMREAWRMEHNPIAGIKYKGLTRVVNGNPVWNGIVRLHEDALDQPIRWRAPKLIFVNSMSDVFHEALSWADIDRIFAIVVMCPHHIFQFLTKRSSRMMDYMNDPETPRRVAEAVRAQMAKTAPKQMGIFKAADVKVAWPPPNAHMGVSAEDQPRANDRVWDLLRTKAAIRWVSAEPLLDDINFERIQVEVATLNALAGVTVHRIDGGLDETTKIDGIVVGGESSAAGKGHEVRAMNPEWARSIREQCATNKTAFFFKQWGEWVYDARVGRKEMRGKDQPLDIDERWSIIRVGKKAAGDFLDGVQHHAWPGIKAPEIEAVDGA